MLGHIMRGQCRFLRPRQLAGARLRRLHGAGSGPHHDADDETRGNPDCRHFRCTIQYDGAGFHGFQSQGACQNVRTVQACIEGALRELNGGATVRVVAAGRTDKGVHASGQVVNFQLPGWRHGGESMLRALNAKLPRDISVIDSRQVEPDFHARYSASFRRYRYSIYNAPHRSPLMSRYAWHVAERLDTDQMQEAANVLLGTHDFSTFGSPPDGEGHCIREIISIKIDSSPAPDAGPNPFSPASPSMTSLGPASTRPLPSCVASGKGSSRRPREMATGASILSIDIVGRSFLYHMVRNIVGSLRLVGAGKETVAGVRERLHRRSRAACGVPAPAHGLTLTEIGYWGEDGGLSFSEWASSRPPDDTSGQRLRIGPPGWRGRGEGSQ